MSANAGDIDRAHGHCRGFFGIPDLRTCREVAIGGDGERGIGTGNMSVGDDDRENDIVFHENEKIDEVHGHGVCPYPRLNHGAGGAGVCDFPSP